MFSELCFMLSPAMTPYLLTMSCAALQAACLLLLSHRTGYPAENLNITLNCATSHNIH